MKLKKPMKIFLGVVIFLTLPSLLFFGFLYNKYHQDIPYGIEGKAADKLATKMLLALNYEAYTSTDYIECTFKNRRHYRWEKSKHTCDVLWKDYKVRLDLNTPSESKAFVHGFTIEGEMGEELVEKAKNYFDKDMFWLIAPFNIFDKHAIRKLVTLENGEKALLITFNNNTSAYLWNFDETGMPKSCNIWGEKVPIDGLETSWRDWQIVETGMKLPVFHKVLFFGMEISDIKVN